MVQISVAGWRHAHSAIEFCNAKRKPSTATRQLCAALRMGSLTAANSLATRLFPFRFPINRFQRSVDVIEQRLHVFLAPVKFFLKVSFLPRRQRPDVYEIYGKSAHRLPLAQWSIWQIALRLPV